MSRQSAPTSEQPAMNLRSIKKAAVRIKKTTGLSHRKALDLAARGAGYASFDEAERGLSKMTPGSSVLQLAETASPKVIAQTQEPTPSAEAAQERWRSFMMRYGPVLGRDYSAATSSRLDDSPDQTERLFLADLVLYMKQTQLFLLHETERVKICAGVYFRCGNFIFEDGRHFWISFSRTTDEVWKYISATPSAYRADAEHVRCAVGCFSSPGPWWIDMRTHLPDLVDEWYEERKRRVDVAKLERLELLKDLKGHRA